MSNEKSTTRMPRWERCEHNGVRWIQSERNTHGGGACEDASAAVFDAHASGDTHVSLTLSFTGPDRAEAFAKLTEYARALGLEIPALPQTDDAKAAA